MDERVTRLEERSGAQTRTMEHLRGDVIELRRSVELLAGELRGEMTALRGEMTALRGEVRQDIGALRGDFDRRFTWLVGIQVAGLVAVVAALVGAYYR